MASVKQLYDLQSLDIAIEKAQQSLAVVKAKLADAQALIVAERELEQKRSEFHALRMSQREAELDLATTESKLRDVEGRLYSGRIGNPKELLGLQEESAHLRALKQRQEERTLSLMEEVEQKEDQVREAEAHLKKVESERETTKGQLELEQKELLEGLVSLDSQRTSISQELSSEERKTYESLRASRGGLAVVRVERGMCMGCRMALPMHELQRVRVARGLVFCSSCGRVLYLS